MSSSSSSSSPYLHSAALFVLLPALLFVGVAVTAVNAIDSINMDLQILENIDLAQLGTQDVPERYNLTYDLLVDSDSCKYALKLDWQTNPADTPGDPDFTGTCDPAAAGNVAPDGQGWHAPRRRWLQFPNYVKDTTGFDHMSMYFRPCGHAPLGFRRARYDMNFYTVIPQYRAFMTCQEYGTPSICQPDQTTHLGRGFFTLPRLERDPNFLANMPLNFQPDPTNPEAFPLEGLIAYNQQKVPRTSQDWELPSFTMSTYDADIVSWRALVPQDFVTGANSSFYFGEELYVHQTMLRLPAGWNLTYSSDSGIITMYVYGSAGVCGESFEEAKAEEIIEIEIGTGSVGEGPSRRRARGVRRAY